MAKTTVRSLQIKDGEVKRSDVNITQTGEALIRRLIAGTNISISSTGVDTGTGDVTVSVSSTPNFTTLSINGTQILDSSRNLSNVGTISTSGTISIGTQATTTSHAVRADRTISIGSSTAKDFTSNRTFTLSEIGAEPETVTTNVIYYSNTNLTAGRRIKRTIQSYSQISVYLPNVSDGALIGDRYTIIGGNPTNLLIKVNGSESVYATINQQNQKYTFYVKQTVPYLIWEIDSVDNHSHSFSDLTSGTMVGTNISLVANSTTATTNSYLGFQRSGALKGVFGNSWAANNLINGSVQDDMCIRNSRDILFSCNGGTNLHARLTSTEFMLGENIVYGATGQLGITTQINIEDKQGTIHLIDVVGGIITSWITV